MVHMIFDIVSFTFKKNSSITLAACHIMYIVQEGLPSKKNYCVFSHTKRSVVEGYLLSGVSVRL